MTYWFLTSGNSQRDYSTFFEASTKCYHPLVESPLWFMSCYILAIKSQIWSNLNTLSYTILKTFFCLTAINCCVNCQDLLVYIPRPAAGTRWHTGAQHWNQYQSSSQCFSSAVRSILLCIHVTQKHVINRGQQWTQSTEHSGNETLLFLCTHNLAVLLFKVIANSGTKPSYLNISAEGSA